MRTKVGVYIPSLLALCVSSCGGLADVISIDPGDLLRLTSSSSSLAADGASIVTLTAQIPAATDPKAREVSFTTSLGSFVESGDDSVDVAADVDGRASVQLESSARLGRAIVRAQIGDAVRSLEIEFTRALPETVVVESDDQTLTVEDRDTATITATLRRGRGVATEGERVQLTAADQFGRAIGIFSESAPVSDSDGEAVATFSPGDTSYRGVVTITARYQHPDGRSLQGTTRVEFVSGSDSLGACCHGGGCQEQVNASTCNFLGGLFSAGNSCGEADCLGACCFGGGCQEQLTAIGCQARGGSFSPGSACVDAPCFGACCIALGDCRDGQTRQSCSALGGGFVSTRACFEIKCSGACCVLSGDCVDGQTSAECGAVSGRYIDGVTCSSDPC